MSGRGLVVGALPDDPGMVGAVPDLTIGDDAGPPPAVEEPGEAGVALHPETTAITSEPAQRSAPSPHGEEPTSQPSAPALAIPGSG